MPPCTECKKGIGVPKYDGLCSLCHKKSLPNRGGLTQPGFGQLPKHVKPQTVGRQHAGRYGMLDCEFACFERAASELKLHFLVRTSHKSRSQALEGARSSKKKPRPKPAGLYTKTNKDAPDAGLVVIKGDTELTLDGSKFKKADFTTSPQGVLLDAQEFPFVGDIDVHGVYDNKGRKLNAIEWIKKINGRLQKAAASYLCGRTDKVPGTEGSAYGVTAQDLVQHGAQDEWNSRNDQDYNKGLNMGALPGVLAFLPGGPIVTLPLTIDYKQFLTAQLGAKNPFAKHTEGRSGQRNLKAQGDFGIGIKKMPLNKRDPRKSHL